MDESIYNNSNCNNVINNEVLTHIAKQYGTPTYVYSGESLEQQYFKLKASLPKEFEVLYSMKSNPSVGVCQLLLNAGSGVEVASSGELYTALYAGFKPENIAFAGPGKTYEELEYAITTDVYCISVESVHEAALINEIGINKSKKVNIALRINPDFNFSSANLKMAGVSSQFGIDSTLLPTVIKSVKKMTNVSIIGIHIYNGSLVMDSNEIVSNMKSIFKLSSELSKKYEINLQFLNLGGGFGINYQECESPLDMDFIKQGLSDVWNTYNESFSKTRVVVESGRYLTGNCGVFLTKILYKKECKGKTYLVCDSGYTQHPSTTILERYGIQRFPISVLGKDSLDESLLEKVTIAGPSCTPVDIVGRDILLNKSEPEDILMITKCGAYGMTYNPLLFLSHPIPLELLYYKKKIHVLRDRGEPKDFIVGHHRLV
jgi:diaminopimelate decarboxylase